MNNLAHIRVFLSSVCRHLQLLICTQTHTYCTYTCPKWPLELIHTIIKRQWKQRLNVIYKQLYLTGTHLSPYFPLLSLSPSCPASSSRDGELALGDKKKARDRKEIRMQSWGGKPEKEISRETPKSGSPCLSFCAVCCNILQLSLL